MAVVTHEKVGHLTVCSYWDHAWGGEKFFVRGAHGYALDGEYLTLPVAKRAAERVLADEAPALSETQRTTEDQ